MHFSNFRKPEQGFTDAKHPGLAIGQNLPHPHPKLKEMIDGFPPPHLQLVTFGDGGNKGMGNQPIASLNLSRLNTTHKPDS